MPRYYTHEFEECNSQWARAFWPPDRARVSDWLIEFQGRRYWLPNRPVTIGSAPRSHICVNDSNVSDAHAQLQIVGDRVALVDLGSSLGTRVDGLPITKNFHLRGGEVVEIGSLVFSVSRFDDLG